MEELTPLERASIVSKEKPTEMEVVPLLFSFSGRIGTKQFLLYFLPLSAIHLVIGFFSFKVAAGVHVLLFWPLFALTSKRCHDYGSFGWIGIMQLVPVLGWLIVLIAGGFTIGDFKDNKYGESIYRK